MMLFSGAGRSQFFPFNRRKALSRLCSPVKIPFLNKFSALIFAFKFPKIFGGLTSEHIGNKQVTITNLLELNLVFSLNLFSHNPAQTACIYLPLDIKNILNPDR